ncbi:MAG: cytochrome b/b6 domain-containing protein [Verrucomicrobiia bacterium]
MPDLEPNLAMCKLSRLRVVLLRAAAAFLLAVVNAQEIPNSACLECHSDKDLTKTDADGKEVSVFVDEAILAASSHKTNSCASCHRDIQSTHPDDEVAPKPVDCAICHEQPSRSFSESVHGLALLAGKAEAASCKDCHGAHNVIPPNLPSSPLHFSKLAATCGECHPQEAQELEESVHGRALAKGMREAPTCSDCHLEHKIQGLRGTSAKVGEEMCSKCHASERINTKYSLPADRVQTFFESYHGLAVQYGSTKAANCASCHGVHRVLPSSDPNSSIHPTHLVETCGKCHPGATENFALAKVHVDVEKGAEFGTVVNRYVRKAYIGLIVVVIGLMLIHNGLAWGRKLAASYRSRNRNTVRMSKAQRYQHLGLLVSFIVLAVTGFALKYPDSWLAWILGGDEAIRRWTHRISGVVLLVLGAVHVVYLISAREGRRLFKDLFPNKQDLHDLFANVRYLTGRSRAKPRFGRFGYIEKAEYWAVLWGTIIMGVTGLVIWFKIDVTQFLPRWAVDVATTIHLYEAILACLAIVVWHFYHVIFDPDVYPTNWAWWDGKVDDHWYAEEHPLDVPGSRQGELGAEADQSQPQAARVPSSD